VAHVRGAAGILHARAHATRAMRRSSSNLVDIPRRDHDYTSSARVPERHGSRRSHVSTVDVIEKVEILGFSNPKRLTPRQNSMAREIDRTPGERRADCDITIYNPHAALDSRIRGICSTPIADPKGLRYEPSASDDGRSRSGWRPLTTPVLRAARADGDSDRVCVDDENERGYRCCCSSCWRSRRRAARARPSFRSSKHRSGSGDDAPRAITISNITAHWFDRPPRPASSGAATRARSAILIVSPKQPTGSFVCLRDEPTAMGDSETARTSR